MPVMPMLAALAATLFAPAFTQVADRATSIIVHTADLNLTRPADVRRLNHRIANAADTACGEPSSADPSGKGNARRCRTETLFVADARRDELIAASWQKQRTSMLWRR